jgi:hypothetical protein
VQDAWNKVLFHNHLLDNQENLSFADCFRRNRIHFENLISLGNQRVRIKEETPLGHCFLSLESLQHCGWSLV